MIRMTELALLLGVTALIVGCGAPSPPDAPTAPAAGDVGHSHGEGPHGGTIADWGGGEYHIEFTVDHDTQQATVYILDGNAKLAAPVRAESLLLSIHDPAFQVELNPAPLEGEADGTSSRFVGTHENFGIVQEFAGTIVGQVNGVPYAGDFKEEPHDHE